ncbi:hypothetical protein M404DRAFT_1008705, partial [Pisolithus tinctorius Marx 270]
MPSLVGQVAFVATCATAYDAAKWCINSWVDKTRVIVGDQAAYESEHRKWHS